MVLVGRPVPDVLPHFLFSVAHKTLLLARLYYGITLARHMTHAVMPYPGTAAQRRRILYGWR